MRIEITLGQLLDSGAGHRVAIHVLLLVHRLQLALEQAEHGINQALAINLGPLLDVLRRECVEIKRIIIRRTGIEPRTPVARDQAVELVGNDVLRGTHAQVVDDLLQMSARSRVVRIGQGVVLLGDTIQQDFLGLVIDRPDLVRALKHHVLEIMGDARVGRVLRPGIHHDGPEYLRLAMVLVQPHRQTITQCMFSYPQELRGRQLRLHGILLSL